MSQVAANPGYDLDLGMCTSFASFVFLCLTTLIILHWPTAEDIRMIGLFNISEEWFILSTNLDSLFSILHTLAFNEPFYLIYTTDYRISFIYSS